MILTPPLQYQLVLINSPISSFYILRENQTKYSLILRLLIACKDL